MEGYYGKGARVKRNQAWFYELYADDVVATLNQVRSSTSTECKKATKAYFHLNNGELPSMEEGSSLLGKGYGKSESLLSHTHFFLLPQYEAGQRTDRNLWSQITVAPKPRPLCSLWMLNSQKTFFLLSLFVCLANRNQFVSFA